MIETLKERTVTVYTTETDDLVQLQTSVGTASELIMQLKTMENPVNLEDMVLHISGSEHSLLSPDAELPTKNFMLLITPQDQKGGQMKAKEARDHIRGLIKKNGDNAKKHFAGYSSNKLADNLALISEFNASKKKTTRKKPTRSRSLTKKQAPELVTMQKFHQDYLNLTTKLATSLENDLILPYTQTSITKEEADGLLESILLVNQAVYDAVKEASLPGLDKDKAEKARRAQLQRVKKSIKADANALAKKVKRYKIKAR